MLPDDTGGLLWAYDYWQSPSRKLRQYLWVQRWNLPDGWVISLQPAHEALVSAGRLHRRPRLQRRPRPRPPDGDGSAGKAHLPAGRAAGLRRVRRRMESAWSNGRPAYRCRHGNTSASAPDPGMAEERVHPRGPRLPHLPALHLLLTGADDGEGQRRAVPAAEPTPGTMPASRTSSRACARTTSTHDLRPGRRNPARGRRRGNPDRHQESKLTPGPEQAHHRKEPGKKRRLPPGAGGSPRPGDDPACPETEEYGDLLCPRDHSNPGTREISPVWGNFHGLSITADVRRRQAFRVPSRSWVGRRTISGAGRSGRWTQPGGHALCCSQSPGRRKIRRLARRRRRRRTSVGWCVTGCSARHRESQAAFPILRRPIRPRTDRLRLVGSRVWTTITRGFGWTGMLRSSGTVGQSRPGCGDGLMAIKARCRTTGSSWSRARRELRQPVYRDGAGVCSRPWSRLRRQLEPDGLTVAVQGSRRDTLPRRHGPGRGRRDAGLRHAPRTACQTGQTWPRCLTTRHPPRSRRSMNNERSPTHGWQSQGSNNRDAPGRVLMARTAASLPAHERATPWRTRPPTRGTVRAFRPGAS